MFVYVHFNPYMNMCTVCIRTKSCVYMNKVHVHICVNRSIYDHDGVFVYKLHNVYI